MKSVIDTNVVISATFFGGIPRKVIDLVVDENISAYTNSEIMTEYDVTAAKMTNKKNGHIDQELFDQFMDKVEVIDAVAEVDVCRDPDDNKFIACAIDAQAIFVVSGDKDLLSVEHYDAIEIVTAKDFYERYISQL